MHYVFSDKGNMHLTVITDDKIASSVQLEGKSIGLTDGEALILPAGEHELLISRQWHRDYRLTVDESAGDVLKVIHIEPITGILSLQSNIDDVSVYLDDTLINPSSPGKYPAIIGTHTLTVKKTDHTTWQQDITVEEGQVTEADAYLELAYGKLMVRSNVWGDNFSIDGVDYGRTGGAYYTLATGEHEITVSKYGHAPWVRTFVIEPGQELTLKASLSPEDSLTRGKRLFRESKYETAMDELLPHAEEGEAKAQEYVAIMLIQGFGVEEDPEAAIEWFKKSAENGNANAQYILSAFYRLGKGVEQSDFIAFKLLREAAHSNHRTAQFELGLMYLNGTGVAQSEEKAWKWMSRASSQNNGEEAKG